MIGANVVKADLVSEFSRMAGVRSSRTSEIPRLPSGFFHRKGGGERRSSSQHLTSGEPLRYADGPGRARNRRLASNAGLKGEDVFHLVVKPVPPLLPLYSWRLAHAGRH